MESAGNPLHPVSFNENDIEPEIAAFETVPFDIAESRVDELLLFGRRDGICRGRLIDMAACFNFDKYPRILLADNQVDLAPARLEMPVD